MRRSVELWVGCIAGALQDTEYQEKLTAAGFRNVAIEPTRVYKELADGQFISAFVRAAKPVQ